MNKNIKRIIIVAIISVIPIIVTLPFAITYERMELVEIMLVIAGCLELLAFNIRSRRKERDNVKKYGRRNTKATDEGYNEYQNVKYILILSGLVSLLLSFIWYLIF